MGQNQRRRCVWSTSQGGGTGGKVAVYEYLVISLNGITMPNGIYFTAVFFFF